MRMEAGLDTGPVLALATCLIEPDDTGGRLHDRLSVMGAQLLKENLDRIAQGELEQRMQDDSQTSYADKIEKTEAIIDWTMSAEQITRQVRAFNPWPVAETRYSGRQLRIWEARPVAMATEQPPGVVLAAGKAGIDVSCGVGALRILAVQLAGARQVSAIDFINAHPLDGVRFGAA
jgi:methionyl-tRNA formyltransferase